MRQAEAAWQERRAWASLLLAPRDASASAYVAWQTAVASLRSAGEVGRDPGEGPGPVDLLWEVYGEQGTRWFHRLGRPRLEAQVGMTAVAVQRCSCSIARRTANNAGLWSQCMNAEVWLLWVRP